MPQESGGKKNNPQKKETCIAAAFPYSIVSYESRSSQNSGLDYCVLHLTAWGHGLLVFVAIAV